MSSPRGVLKGMTEGSYDNCKILQSKDQENSRDGHFYSTLCFHNQKFPVNFWKTERRRKRAGNQIQIRGVAKNTQELI